MFDFFNTVLMFGAGAIGLSLLLALPSMILRPSLLKVRLEDSAIVILGVGLIVAGIGLIGTNPTDGQSKMTDVGLGLFGALFGAKLLYMSYYYHSETRRLRKEIDRREPQ
jgi:hypothetical protein